MKITITILLLLAWIPYQLHAQPRAQRTAVSGDSMYHAFDTLLQPVASTGVLTYLWWFGDNYFSFKEKPTHQYRETVDDTLRVVVTENYSNSGPPPSYSVILPPNLPQNSSSNTDKILNSGEIIRIQNYREAIPGDTIYFIVSYASDYASNRKDGSKDGSNYIEGERQIRIKIDPDYQQFFATVDNVPNYYCPNGESESSSLVWNIPFEPIYLDKSMLIPMVVSTAIGEHLYEPISFEVQMTQDGAVNGADTIEVLSLPSHDPNAMVTQSTQNSCSISENDVLDYTVHFQNIGEGPTSKIQVKTFLDPRLDKNEIHSVSFHGNFPPCGTSVGSTECFIQEIDRNRNLVTWTLHNVILLGSNQSDCSDLELTKGYVKFKIRPLQDFVMGNDISCYSDIIFDNNEKIKTNDALITCEEKEPCQTETTCHWIFWVMALIILILLLKLYLPKLRSKHKS